MNQNYRVFDLRITLLISLILAYIYIYIYHHDIYYSYMLIISAVASNACLIMHSTAVLLFKPKLPKVVFMKSLYEKHELTLKYENALNKV